MNKALVVATLLGLLLAFMLSASCAQMFACKTDASYIIRPDGTKEISYSSCKEQIGLDADVSAKTGDIKVKVDKATTQEAVMLKMLEILGPLIQQATKAGAVAGS